MKTRWLIFLQSRLLSVLSLLLLMSTRAGSESRSQQFSTENKWFEKYLDKYDKYSANMPVLLYLHCLFTPPSFFCIFKRSLKQCAHQWATVAADFRTVAEESWGLARVPAKQGLEVLSPGDERVCSGAAHTLRIHRNTWSYTHIHSTCCLPALVGGSLNN